MRVLLIEDDPTTSNVMKKLLTDDGIVCDTTRSGEEGLEIMRLWEYDSIILDLSLPDIEGISVLRRLRAAGIDTPVFIVTSASDTESAITTLNAGADDFLSKPFNQGVFFARLQAIARRSKGHSHPVITSGSLKLDLSQREAYVNDEPIHLTYKEYQCLELLMRNKGCEVGKETFLNHLYGGFDEPELKIIDVFICKLRSKIGDDDHRQIITVWGKGYKLINLDPPASHQLTNNHTQVASRARMPAAASHASAAKKQHNLL